jgi:drug/metabolite transporter (DMT)-like permease
VLNCVVVKYFCRYTSWSCIELVSATSYTLVGVVNKFLTVLLNVLIWDKHSSPFGLLAVCLCLGGGVFYEQAPMRQDPRIATNKKDNSNNDAHKNVAKL